MAWGRSSRSWPAACGGSTSCSTPGSVARSRAGPGSRWPGAWRWWGRSRGGAVAGGAHLLEARTLALGAVVGMLSSAIPYSFEIEAMRRIAPAGFGVLMSLEPGMAAIAGLVVLGQGLSARSVAGIALVVCASVGASRKTRETPVAV